MCHFNSIPTQIRASHMSSLCQLCYGNTYCTAATAQVKHISAFLKAAIVRLPPESSFCHKLQCILNHGFRVLPWYQNLVIDLKWKTHELLSSCNVLQWHSGCTLCNQVKICFALVVLQNLLPPEHQIRPVHSLHEAVKLLRIYVSIGNPGITELLCSNTYQFLKWQAHSILPHLLQHFPLNRIFLQNTAHHRRR